ncbi:MAG: glycosyltransferase family 4 protein [Alicyclobacillus shizuokensis]|nr:glycosyltransferase family 4 protein [Alicyclobacillus shizuokensis]
MAKGAERGGAASHLLALADALRQTPQRRAYRFVVTGSGYLREHLQAIGVPVIDLPDAHLQALTALVRLLMQQPQAVLNAHGPRMNALAALAAHRCGCRWTSTIHSDPRHDFSHRRLRGRLWSHINTRFLQRADGLFMVNPDYQSLCPDRPSYHVPNAAVLTPLPQPRSHYRRLLRERLGIPTDATVVGVSARLHPSKSIDTLIRAMARIERPRLYLAVAGWGPSESALKRLVGELQLSSRTRFLGYCDWMPEFYAGLDCHVLCSRSEGFGLSILEAGFYGVPNIGSDIPGIRQLITDGATGLLAPVGDADALAACIARLLDHPATARQLAVRFQETVLPSHTPQRLLAAYEHGFQALLGLQEMRNTWPFSL